MPNGMKITISLPDALFHAADRLAAQLGLSRSRLYARALADYVGRHEDAGVTTKLDEVYRDDAATPALDPAFARAQLSALSEKDR
jgi:hypothetical protein